MTTAQTPRLAALGVVTWQDHLLVVPSSIPGDPPAWRCPGGRIQLGERAHDAVTREFIEELGRRIDVIEALPVIEDIRVHGGEVGHELSFPFLASWHDGYEPFDFSPIMCVETDGTRFEARWLPLAELTQPDVTIHPAGFVEMLLARLRQPPVPDEERPPRVPTPIRRPLAEGETLRGAQRVIALGHLIWRDHLLLCPVPDAGAPPAFRSLGGGVEFGERAEDAVRRELREETGRAVEIARATGAAENIFERDGVVGHEVVFEYLVGWAPGDEPADLGDLECREPSGEPFAARWMPLDEVLSGRHEIYPEGFVDRLRGWLAEDGRA